MLSNIKNKANSVSASVKSAKSKLAEQTDSVFQKYASKEDLVEYKSLLATYGTVAVNKLKESILKKNYSQAKLDYQQASAQEASNNRKNAKPKSEYEEWKASQPTKNIDKNWLSLSENFINKNQDSIIGISDLLNKTETSSNLSSSTVSANLTPTVKNAINNMKDNIKTKQPLTDEEKKEIAKKNPKSVSMKIYSFIRDSEKFTPFCAEQGYAIKIGFGHIVDVNSPYYTMYPAREDDYLIEEYYEHVSQGDITEWIQSINPSIIPVDMVYNLFNKDINNIEKIINKELTDVVLKQNEFDAIASFLWTMQDESLIYDEFQPNRIIKELHTLLFYNDDRKVAAEYIRDVDKRLIQSSNRWNRRQAEITLFLTGTYESLNSAVLEKYNYEDIFSTMKNEYIANKNGDKKLKCFNKFLGNDSLLDSINQCEENNINLYVPYTNGITTSSEQTGSGSGSSGGSAIGTEEKTKTNTIKKEFSANDIIGEELLNSMIYPIVGKIQSNRGGKDNTGINNNNTICYGWFGSDRGEGQGIHYGVDLLCDKNSPIVMPYDGTIISVGLATVQEGITLKRVVFIPDANKDIVISIYYLDNLFVEKDVHYNAGELIGYVGDCSSLFDLVNKPDNFIPYDYIHIQFNRYSEKGLPLNPTTAILLSSDAQEPEVITNLKNNPLVYDSIAGLKTINIQHKGKYRIVLVGHGGSKISYNLEPIPESELPDIEPRPKKYGITGGNGAYVNVTTMLNNQEYNYYVSDLNHHCSFNNELIAEHGLAAGGTNSEEVVPGANFTIPENYTLYSASKGNTRTTVSNICGYDIQTGECVPFVIKASIGAPYETFGKGGDVGLNDGVPSDPTSGLVYIQYINWN